MKTPETRSLEVNQRGEGSGVDPTKVWILLDRSGSMGRLQEAVIEGTNRFLHDQREESGECRLTLAQFDTQDPFELIVDDMPLAAAPELNAAIYQPRGTTPLYDAIGTLITRADQRLERRAADGLAPDDQTVLIYTDGLENASSDFDREQILELIQERTARGWQFVYMGANQDAYAEGSKIGIGTQNTAAWEASSTGIKDAMATNSRRLLAHRRRSRAARSESPAWFRDEPPASGTESN